MVSLVALIHFHARRLGLEAVRCQSAEMARAWCIARVAIGTSEKGGWQRVAGPKRSLSYVGEV